MRSIQPCLVGSDDSTWLRCTLSGTAFQFELSFSLRASWDETWHILHKAVARGMARKTSNVMPCIGIDEKAFRKGHNYITMVYDLDNSTAEAISDGNAICGSPDKRT